MVLNKNRGSKKMTELFNKEDILTILTADKAKIGDKGYFGDTLEDIKDSVECGKIYSLVWIDNKNLSVYSFKNDFFDDNFALFLPADKVKKLTYRALENIDELFSFMLPDFDGKKYTTDEKIDMLLGLHYALKDKDDGTIRYYTVHFLGISDYGTIILNDFDLMYLFERYEYRKGDEFVPFGVEK